MDTDKPQENPQAVEFKNAAREVHLVTADASFDEKTAAMAKMIGIVKEIRKQKPMPPMAGIETPDEDIADAERKAWRTLEMVQTPPPDWKGEWRRWLNTFKRAAKRQEIIAIAKMWQGTVGSTAKYLGIDQMAVLDIVRRPEFTDIMEHELGAEASIVSNTDQSLEFFLASVVADETARHADRMKAAEFLAKKNKWFDKDQSKDEKKDSLVDMLHRLESKK